MDLNTSHVTIQPRNKRPKEDIEDNLNTSHVTIQQKELEDIKDKMSFKYISCYYST